ncbi:hypothetical protein I2492_04210 [Budviciaceae bacterium CWB-B4]|uniref:Uncharacterized protein n=1 Tax=Limnobaculum xujianqingii TaxID=2738837 RepID=A0A9D7AGD9_9GAMM|nr:DUF6731 family protein [Limnobaculum xujianqingii]MBK5072219.1 hypothetical protein [Limnobaculum xujianqingii]MBK5175528.1 hypothetical protein [Limnobaculum xujianqingii]
MKKSKTFTVRFYKVRFGADGKQGNLGEVLVKEVKARKQLPIMKAGDSAYQVRGLNFADDQSISGYLVRFRNDKPSVGSQTNLTEEVLELEDGKEFIEKNHFILFQENEESELLTHQSCMEGAHVRTLFKYFTFLINEKETISYDEILTKESLDVIFNKGMIKSVEFSIAKPKKAAYQPDPEDGWTQEAFEMMEETGATVITSKVAIRAKNKGLKGKIIGSIKKLIGSDQTTKLKVKMSDESEPIDLLTERVYGKIEVQLTAESTIDSIKVYDEIRGLKDKKQKYLDIYFKA